MRSIVTLSALSLTLFVSLGCDGSNSPTVVTNPEAGMVRMELTGNGCGGTVWWSVGSAGNFPDGEAVSFPWSLSVPGASGDMVNIEACESCEVQCPLPPCAVTLTTRIYWEGALLVAGSTTGSMGVGCWPPTDMQATIP
jgi:hypothetical protein